MIHNSKYVFFGTPEFAAIVLDKLISAGFPPSAVVCNPDRPVGRKKIITPPATKSQIMVRGSRFMDEIKILQPEKLDSGFEHQISNIKPEFGIVAAYAKIIPKNIIELFPKGVIGVHPSLLPKYRGASPIQSAILDGEKEAGVTLYLLDEKMDHGPILEQRELEFPISNFQFPRLHDELAKLGGKLLVETLPEFVAGKIESQAQNEAGATYTKKFTSEDGFVSESDLHAALGGNSEKAAEIDRKIRALGTEPGVWTVARSIEHGAWNNGGKPFDSTPLNPIRGRQGKRTKLLEAKLENGRLVLMRIQEEGERPKMSAP